MPIDLDDQQATAILVEALARKIYEPAVPPDEKTRLEDAGRVIEAAQAAYNNKNRSENVITLLNIANNGSIENGTSAQISADDIEKILVVTDDGKVFDKDTGVILEDNSIHNGLDLSTLADPILESLIDGLDKYPNNESVEADRKAYVAEKERRANAKGQKFQEIAPPATGGEAAQKAGEITSEGSPSTDEGAGKRAEEVEGPDAGATAPDGGVGRQAGSADENAGAFARAQTPETQPEGKASKAKAPAQDAERSAIEAELTLPACKAHGIDLTKIPETTTEQLKFIVENPEGPPKEDKVAISESEVEASARQSNIKGVSVGGISAAPAPQEVIVTKADLGLSVAEDITGDVSAEREKLESLITGPMLKVYRRGRKEIPAMGDNELRLMILNPDGKITPDELEKAKALDSAGSVDIVVLDDPNAGKTFDKLGSDSTEIRKEGVEELHKIQDDLTLVTLPSGQKVRVKLPDVGDSAQKPAESGKESSPESLASPIKASEEEQKDRTIAQAAKEAVTKVQPVTADTHAEKSQQQNRAMEIIRNEGMPIPPNYKDEQAPVLPQDVSKISRDELFSLHAQFHAYESRMNWVLTQYEDELYDYVKMRNYREAIVANEVPFMGEDGRRNTNEYREGKVRGDQEVLDLGMKEHEVEKIIKRLKTLNNNYHRDCERMSRQMSKYETERLDAPR